MKGWMGRLLWVDLTSGSGRVEPLPVDLASAYLGGRGLGARMLFGLVPPGLDPLAPENPLILAVGPLTGTKSPTSGRASLTTKAPLSGAIHDSNVGGQWGYRMKRTGFDAVIITGRAQVPVYLEISETGAEIKPAAGLWGRDTVDTTRILKERVGSTASVLSIGPAGENRVLLASILADGSRSLGRGGVGAVMGSKNLKAVVANGQRPIEAADPERFEFVVYEANKQVKAHPVTSKALPEFGTSVLMNIMNEAGALPAYNHRKTVFEGADEISGEAIAGRILIKRSACYGCRIGCGRVTRTSRSEGHGPEYETVWALGAQCGISDLEAVTEANHLCNRLGLDTISVGSTIACAMELAESGRLQADLGFGRAGLLVELVRQTAEGRDLGAEIGLGSRRLAARYGAPDLAMQVKGVELPAYDPRGMKAQGLGYATSNRGGCHLRGNMLGPEILGSPKMIDRFSFRGKAGLLIVLQHTAAVLDSLSVCKFSHFALGDEFFARLLSAAAGQEFRAQDLQRIGERIWNLERLFNLREGFTRADDTLPPRILNEAPAEGPSRGQTVDLDLMLDEYYRFRGWDPAGVPTPPKLRELGLDNLGGPGTGASPGTGAGEEGGSQAG